MEEEGGRPCGCLVVEQSRRRRGELAGEEVVGEVEDLEVCEVEERWR